jgi:peptidyl-prolyl cis-trans isomerase D
MLDTLRNSVGSWVVKGLIALLVVSFAVWGIGDVFTGYRGASLARVGNTEISNQDYQRVQQQELRTLSSQVGRTLTLSEARQMGLDERVMARLIGGAAVDAHADAMSLGISDAGISQQIVTNPAFQDATGNFNRMVFQQVLASNGLSESAFVESERQLSLRRQLLETVGAVPHHPDTLVNAMERYNNESRILRYVVVPQSAAGEVDEPTEEELKRYYDNNKGQFTRPEYRKIGILAVTPETVRDQIELTEDEIKETYEARKETFGRPERRRVQQISFDSVEDAKAAKEKIEQGTDFVEIGKEQGFSEIDIDLGMLREDQLADPAIASTAFRLSENDVSDPVESRLGGAVLLRVTQIEPGIVRLFEEARRDVENELYKQRAGTHIFGLYDKIEDMRGGGATLPEVAEELGLEYREIDAVDRQGRDPNGNNPNIPARNEVLQLAFESDEGVETDPVDLHDEGFVWVDVLGMTSAELRPFDEVRDEVTSRWRSNAGRTKLASYTQELVTKLRDGGSLDEIAKELDRDVVTSSALRRAHQEQNIPNAAVMQAFSLPEGGFGAAPSGQANSRIVFQVDKIWVPGGQNPEAVEQLKTDLDSMVGEDLLAQYVTGLQERYGVTLNRQALNRLMGVEEE